MSSNTTKDPVDARLSVITQTSNGHAACAATLPERCQASDWRSRRRVGSAAGLPSAGHMYCLSFLAAVMATESKGRNMKRNLGRAALAALSAAVSVVAIGCAHSNDSSMNGSSMSTSGRSDVNAGSTTTTGVYAGSHGGETPNSTATPSGTTGMSGSSGTSQSSSSMASSGTGSSSGSMSSGSMSNGSSSTGSMSGSSTDTASSEPPPRADLN